MANEKVVKSKMIGAWVTPREYKDIVDVCASKNITISSFMRDAVAREQKRLVRRKDS